jgi:hypothetical protein
MTILFGILLILHGLVHFLYAGHSRRLFELRPGFLWPESSWLFSKPLGVRITRLLVTRNTSQSTNLQIYQSTNFPIYQFTSL